jgi:hypothetical protein
MFWQSQWGYIAGRAALDSPILTLPVNTALPMISGSPSVGSTLSTTDGTWTGTPTPTFTYQWKRGGTNISGATANSYLLVSGDSGTMITATVTATNPGGSVGATSTGVGPITTPVTYVTWDVATASNITFSGGNLVTTSAGGGSDHGAHVAAASGKTSGKYYFEVTVTTYAGGADSGMGIGTPTSTYAGIGGSATVGDLVYIVSGGVWANGSNIGAIGFGNISAGKVVGIAVDMDNRKIWFRLAPSGNWNSNAAYDPVANIGGVTIPSGTMVPFCVFNASGNVFTANFGASSFSGAVPSGFTAGWPAGTPSFATWDPATVAAVTLSGGSLVATNTGTTSTNQGAQVASTSGKTTGKYYFEVTATTFTNGAGVGAGVGTTAATYAGLTASYTGGDLNLVVGHNGSGVITAPSGNSGLSLGALASGDTICVAVDLTDSRIWFRKNASGLWNGNTGQDPTLPSGSGGGNAVPAGTIVPFVTFGSGLAGAAGLSGNVMTANFGASSFVGAVPSGYTAGWPA